MTDLLGQTTFVSLYVGSACGFEWLLTFQRYQAGEGIYQQFDKVLVIDSGREVSTTQEPLLES